MKVNNNYNPLISPLSCSPNLCWELMLLGDLFAKKNVSFWDCLQAHCDRSFQDFFCLLPVDRTPASWYLETHGFVLSGPRLSDLEEFQLQKKVY